jgi:hypothetical protein
VSSVLTITMCRISLLPRIACSLSSVGKIENSDPQSDPQKRQSLHDLGGLRRSPRVCKSLKNLRVQVVTAEVSITHGRIRFPDKWRFAVNRREQGLVRRPTTWTCFAVTSFQSGEPSRSTTSKPLPLKSGSGHSLRSHQRGGGRSLSTPCKTSLSPLVYPPTG